MPFVIHKDSVAHRPAGSAAVRVSLPREAKSKITAKSTPKDTSKGKDSSGVSKDNTIRGKGTKAARVSSSILKAKSNQKLYSTNKDERNAFKTVKLSKGGQIKPKQGKAKPATKVAKPMTAVRAMATKQKQTLATASKTRRQPAGITVAKLPSNSRKGITATNQAVRINDKVAEGIPRPPTPRDALDEGLGLLELENLITISKQITFVCAPLHVIHKESAMRSTDRSEAPGLLLLANAANV